MKVTLIQHAADAADVMLFTKSTRLEMRPGLLAEIAAWPEEKKLAELAYMARTVPSSWEFSDYTFAIEDVTRAFTHQLVRTRTGSYAQQAMRVLDVTAGGTRAFGYETGPSIADDPMLAMAYEGAMRTISEDYAWLLKNGAKPEDARGILPTNIHTNIVAKFNLRTLADTAKKRLRSNRVQDEYRAVMAEMIEAVLEVHPWAHLFLLPREKDTVANLRKLSDRLKVLERSHPTPGAIGQIATDIAKEADVLAAELGDA